MMKYVTTARALSVLKAQYILRRPRKVKGRKKKKTNLNININCYLSIHAINIDVNDVNRPGKVKTNCWHVFFFFKFYVTAVCNVYNYRLFFLGLFDFVCVCARAFHLEIPYCCCIVTVHKHTLHQCRCFAIYIYIYIYILKYIYS